MNDLRTYGYDPNEKKITLCSRIHHPIQMIADPNGRYKYLTLDEEINNWSSNLERII